MIKKMNNIFGWIAIPQVVCIICILCGIIFNLTNKESSSYSLILEALLMAINMFSELGLYCVTGNELHYQASLLPEYIFQANWHNLNSNEFKKDLMFVLQRSQDIPYLNAYGLYNFDLNFFIKVVKMSFSIYTFFTQIKK